MDTAWITLGNIEIGERRRPFDQKKVEQIKSSVRDLGLQTPISVTIGDDEEGCTRVRLVAGRHRLEALVQLGEEDAECIVVSADLAELWEIDENLARAELTDAQRADHHVRREAILVRRGEVLAGAGKPSNSDKLSELTSYARRASADLGVDERTVRRDLARGRKIAPEVLTEVQGTDLDKGVVLDELARTPQPEQRAKVAEIALRRQEAERARKDAETINRSTDRVIALSDAQAFAEWLMARTDLNEMPTIEAWLGRCGPFGKDTITAMRRDAA